MGTPKIAVVYTSSGSVEMMKRELQTAIPGCEIANLIDDSLIREVMQAGGMTASVRRRMHYAFLAAADLQPDVIVCACSSVGEAAESADLLLDMPVVRIDRAMLEKAAAMGGRVGVLASLASTLEPTADYLRRIARACGRELAIECAVAEGAYEANRDGDPARHDRLLLETAQQLARQADVLVLAQGSMAKLEQTLSDRLGKPVLSSPRLCAEQVRALIARKKEGKMV